MRTIIIDTETTGLDCNNDELLQVSIIGDDEEVLYDSYFKPERATEWKDAEKENHITPAFVEKYPHISDEIEKINKILLGADCVVGYNTFFDVGFLRAAGATFRDDTEFTDVMTLFAPVFGDFNEYFGDYTCQSLATCAEYYGYEWNNRGLKAHNSLADCFATLFCYNKITDTLF